MILHGWESSLKDRRVRFAGPALSGLRMLAIEAFAALPRRGIEVGGILFGEAEGDEARIDAFEEAPCEHRYGPSYSLSAADKAKLGELLAERTPPPKVVGFFRSFTNREPTIEEGDEALVREHFPRGDFLYLCLQPLSVENCVATVRFFRDGQLLPETEDPPFAFDLRQLPAMEPPAEAKPDPAPLAPPLPPPFRASLDEPAPRRARWWIPALVSLIVGVVGGIYYELAAIPRDRQWTELHLDAHSEAGRLDVTWDTNVSTVSNAVRGRLSVTDSGIQRDIALTAAQVHAGKISLSPAQANLGLRLVIYEADGTAVGDALRVAMIPSVAMPEDRQAAVPPVTAPQPQSPPQSAQAPPAPVTRSAGVAVPPSTVREVQPRIPEGIRSRIANPVVIPVEVQVSDQGRVVRATAEASDRDGVHRYLAAQAQRAAREWRFKPARTKSGATIAASKTIQFVFNP